MFQVVIEVASRLMHGWSPSDDDGHGGGARRSTKLMSDVGVQ